MHTFSIYHKVFLQGKGRICNMTSFVLKNVRMITNCDVIKDIWILLVRIDYLVVKASKRVVPAWSPEGVEGNISGRALALVPIIIYSILEVVPLLHLYLWSSPRWDFYTKKCISDFSQKYNMNSSLFSFNGIYIFLHQKFCLDFTWVTYNRHTNKLERVKEREKERGRVWMREGKRERESVYYRP
jgi:hypothetical protein